MSIAVLQDKIRARKTPLALVLSPEADKLNPKITKNFTDLYGPGDMAEAEALRYHGSQLIGQAAPLLPAVVLRAERYLRCGFMGMDVLANLVNMAKTQGLYTIVDARTSAPEVYPPEEYMPTASPSPPIPAATCAGRRRISPYLLPSAPEIPPPRRYRASCPATAACTWRQRSRWPAMARP